MPFPYAPRVLADEIVEAVVSILATSAALFDAGAVGVPA